jgi:hypothetical protein
MGTFGLFEFLMLPEWQKQRKVATMKIRVAPWCT